MDLDYEKLGFKCGIEIHQQLDSRKLFCDCPPDIRDEPPDYTVTRRMRAVAGELGNVDPAALHEFLRDRTLRYEGYQDTTCLVELDEEPPHPVNQHALDVALEVALLLSASVVDEIHVMRKTVIDGSNTSGFQRTMLVAHDGVIDTSRGPVGIPSICLEEDAARIICQADGCIVYRLDRLGIPLVEIATDASIRGPAHAREVAEKIGGLLRQTGKVKRGLGTIRQDLNVSIEKGERIEVKGVQDLKLVAKVVEGEVKRQLMLLAVKDTLVERGFGPEYGAWADEARDLTALFRDSSSSVIKAGLSENHIVVGLRIRGFKGLLKDTLGPELAQYVRATSRAKGIFHSDELPAYGITQKEVAAVSQALDVGPDDAFVLVVEQPGETKKALTALLKRCRNVLEGVVPDETRRAKDDGSSEFMRPLPGSARMYPETDAPVIAVDEEHLAGIAANLPESFADKQKRYESWGLSAEMANQMVHSPQARLFEGLHESYPCADISVLASILISYPKEAEKRHGIDPSTLTPHHYEDITKYFVLGTISSSTIPELIAALSTSPEKPVETVIEKEGLGSISGKELETLVESTVTENKDLAAKMGEKALGPLTGKVMAKARGRADAKAVQALIKKRL